ncbi:energy-coupling factor transporter ATP-binding protein EcfA2 [Microbacterium trichothecenolyticum]|uniref:AAA family ATPase n=1 Tax=Microbacterium trichothecenolyticum TaxID=69370 RepID=UPI0028566EB8|nr:AAA family ATPase [Microbacterium trichothecenolyticum]MDR7113738.1 energy-coupling factor transporter ATP-binding protein EcfA2 [Microbacterium trichothecenolyticum]
MRGGLERWKRGVESQGVRQAVAYALKGSCDSHLRSAGVDALAGYGAADAAGLTRFTVEAGVIRTDVLDEVALRRWVDGCDPVTGERRGRDLRSADADLILDGTINAAKSYSIAALINPDLANEFEALQDRLRDRIITIWQRELNARRGAAGRIREALHRVEVVELQHRRSRALDPHIHRHLWLNVKVLGQDGKWSNVDSRVAMKMHTLINAEGELAARTDPAWLSALARHGYTLNSDGEIAELVSAVRPLSRRSTQIEANRAMLLADWRAEHPGQQPSPDQLHQIDRLAWAKARPNRPGELDETAWEHLIVDELESIDPTILAPRAPVPLDAIALESLDLDLLGCRATVEADARSTACGGRFSLFDIRAGATRAVGSSGVVASREELQQTIDEVTHRALELTVDLLPEEAQRPAHVKGFMATATAALKLELAARLDALTRAGIPTNEAEIAQSADQVLRRRVALDELQVRAAAAIAGTDRLVSVTGPAGAGKTTMLRVARAALADRGRGMVVVAPTKKAASVAGRELGTTASSLHALLSDHGFRWVRDAAGAEIWTRLMPGSLDPSTGQLYAGPRRFPLTAGDRVVVDEAGMIDLRTANALATVAADTGAGIAMVGDHLQARPVGHSGAMAALTRRATAVVELTSVHRFRDPEYAALTLRMREPASKEAALAVAAELDQLGLIHRVSDHVQARDVMVEAYFRWTREHHRVALVTSTNEEADAINEAIQQRRVDTGDLSLLRIAVGQGEQRLLEGDVVQTRRNDRNAGVENRAAWTIRRITPTGLELVSLDDSADIRTVTFEYVAQHVHLAYASTVHGIQGETTDASIVGPGVDAAGLYVGMTRGRTHNEAVAIADTVAAARDRIADSMIRGVPEVSIDDSIRAAQTELSRAARSPEADLSTVCNDPAPHIGQTPTEGQRGERPARLALEETNDWLHATWRTLLELDARIAGDAATGHARTPATDHQLREARAQLADRYQARSEEYAGLLQAYEEERMAQAVETERRIRAAVEPTLHRADPTSILPVVAPGGSANSLRR